MDICTTLHTRIPGLLQGRFLVGGPSGQLFCPLNTVIHTNLKPPHNHHATTPWPCWQQPWWVIIDDLDHGNLNNGDLDHGDLDHGDLGHGDLDHGDLDHSGLQPWWPWPWWPWQWCWQRWWQGPRLTWMSACWLVEEFAQALTALTSCFWLLWLVWLSRFGFRSLVGYVWLCRFVLVW